MADGILHLFSLADREPSDREKDITQIKPPIGGDFEKVILIDRAVKRADITICPGDFTDTDTDLQYVERNLDTKGSPEFADNWMYRGTAGRQGTSFYMEVMARALLIIFKDSASVSVGEASVYVDGEKKLFLDPHIVGWTHCNPAIVFRQEKAKKHCVEIRIDEKDTDKDFTILGFGIVE